MSAKPVPTGHNFHEVNLAVFSTDGAKHACGRKN
jgi:hypothetical protein